jgi:hypothetical protein
MWASGDWKPSYKWSLRNGRNIKFGRSVDYSLSQFWDLFYKCNEPDVYALDTLNGVDLKSTWE